MRSGLIAVMAVFLCFGYLAADEELPEPIDFVATWQIVECG